MAQRHYYENMRQFGPGSDLVDSLGDRKTVLNADPQAKQVDEISVTGGAGSANEVYEIKIERQLISYDAANGTNQDDVGQGLADAINANNLVNGRVTASYDAGTDTITVTARWAGIGFSYTEVSDPNSILSQTRTQDNQTANPLPWGRLVEEHGSIGQKLGRLADASNMTSKQIDVDVGGSADGNYTVTLEVNGETLVATFDASNDSKTDIVDDLVSDIDGHNLLAANNNSDILEITPETSGFADFSVQGLNAPQEPSVTLATEGDDINQKMAGVAMVGGEELIEPDEQVGRYPPSTEVDVKYNGAQVGVAAEEQVSKDDTVFVRLAASGNNDKLGAFRGSHDAGVVPLKGAEFVKAPNADVAGVELP